MDLITTSSEHQLPVALEDLAQFVLIGREQLTAVRAGIRALDKLDVAEGVRKQKKEEAQMLAEALLDAEVRIGEILAAMPKAGGGDRRSENFKMDSAVHFENSKLQTAKELGFNEKQVQRFQTLAANKDLVEAIKQEAREADDLPTRTAVLQAVKIRDNSERFERKAKTSEADEDQIKRLNALKSGVTVIANMNRDFYLISEAQKMGKYVRCDRFSEWGNPFVMGEDGTREEVIFYFGKYLKMKKGWHNRIEKELKGKVLGCHCYPEMCHCYWLSRFSMEGSDCLVLADMEPLYK
jgi:hypothetical protein